MPGPNGCNAAIIIHGEHFWCEERIGRGYDKCDHGGWAHGNVAAQTIWGYADIHSDVFNQMKTRSTLRETGLGTNE